MKKIMIVEDELPISHVLKAYLNKQYEIIQVFDGHAVMEHFKAERPDLVLLDVMLPGKDGWTILKELRTISKCPVIMLTALDDVQYKLKGFDGGADDYIAKPFVGDEVVARVNAVLRRSSKEDKAIIMFGQLQLDTSAHIVKVSNEEIFIAPRDLAVLFFLAEHPNRTFTREELIEHIWGWDYDGSDRAVDLAIKRLRKALSDWPEEEGEIKTLRGLGYQLRVNEQ
jgi:DNA-binding response OmpR family regulator